MTRAPRVRVAERLRERTEPTGGVGFQLFMWNYAVGRFRSPMPNRPCVTTYTDGAAEIAESIALGNTPADRRALCR